MGNVRVNMSQADDACVDEVTLRVEMGDREHALFFRGMNGVKLRASGEAAVAAVLPNAMAAGVGSVEMDRPVCGAFLENMAGVQGLFDGWYEFMKPVELRVPVRAEASEDAGESCKQVGCFFTGGLDSFATFHRHRDEIDALIYIHGFDVRLHETELREKVSGALREVAAKTGKQLIEVETNLRDFYDVYVDWVNVGHGPAIWAVGHLLSGQFGKLYLSGAIAEDDLTPCATHPELDPLWSTSRLTAVHDAAELTRIDKARLLADDEVAMRHLRVCWKNRGGAYNCGQCEKCLRTMINLSVVGALEKCTAFERGIDLNLVKQIVVRKPAEIAVVRQNYEALKARGDQPGLEKALKRVLYRPKWQYKLLRMYYSKKRSLMKRLPGMEPPPKRPNMLG